MKTATLPVTKQPELFRAQQELIARGLASCDAAKKSGVYFSADEVLEELDEILAKAGKKARK